MMVNVMQKKQELERLFGKKILVTGHSGFIGSWLTKCLTMLDAEVCGYALDPPTKPNLYETLKLSQLVSADIRGDINDTDLLKKTLHEFQPEIVFHLAAQPLVLESYDDPVRTFHTNVTGTVNLLNELRKVDSIRAIIVVTSDKAYLNKEWVYPYRENDELGGRDPYSASKSCQDIVVNSFRESYFSDSGIALSSVRAGNVIGGGDWAKNRIIPDIVRGIVSGQPVSIRNPNSVRPWQHVLEPVSGMMILAQKMVNDVRFSGAWNFGPNSEREVTVKEIAETVISFWGSGRYGIEDNYVKKESKYLSLDISKAKGELKWFPKYNISVALKETVDWYKLYYNNYPKIENLTYKQITSYLGV
jgi:CDP-glucose 4,6-dehydratase